MLISMFVPHTVLMGLERVGKGSDRGLVECWIHVSMVVGSSPTLGMVRF